MLAEGVMNSRAADPACVGADDVFDRGRSEGLHRKGEGGRATGGCPTVWGTRRKDVKPEGTFSDPAWRSGEAMASDTKPDLMVNKEI